MKHPESVDGISAKELANKFMKTTYAYQLDFFEEMSVLYSKEGEKDSPMRPQLAAFLEELTMLMLPVCEKMKRIWKICKSRTNI